MNKTLLLALGLPFTGALSFGMALWAHFPDEAVIERLRFEVQDRSDGAFGLEASSARPWLPLGLTLKDVTLLEVEKPVIKRRRGRKNKEAEEEEEQPPAAAVPLLRASSASVRLAILPLIIGRRQLDVDADLYGGEIEGSIAQSSDRRIIDLAATEIDLAQVPFSGETWSIDANGLMDLTVDLDLPEAGSKGAGEGTIKLSVDALKFAKISVGGMDMMPATFTEALLEMEVSGSKAEITKGVLEGDVLDAQISGNLTFNASEPSRWRMRIEIGVELDEQLDKMASMLPNLRSAKDSEGVYHFLCSGTLGNPVCREDRAKAGGSTRTGPNVGGPSRTPRIANPKLQGPDMGPDMGPGGPTPLGEEDLDPEVRRQQRRDRIKERRDRLRKQREEGGPPDRGEFEEEAAPPGFERPGGGPNEPEFIPPEEPPPFEDEIPMDEGDFEGGPQEY